MVAEIDLQINSFCSGENLELDERKFASKTRG